ncbi:DUF1304 domain-containing protein [Micropruina sonneratiae]|uniref:DUF1304 domain-containing protein n=1 Tax=Micropruina sonneratiae TaxID=2986940 RepID=UPI00222788DB|nr:DUF1304 domain-containing protein [Micropruina sp. KQZ13P-5]MCW3158438.1 DUF1304 domain-containing protein [Micropruina sp. KQZ13P-5]
MRLIALLLAAVAGVIPVGIFFLESLRWEHPDTRKVFGTSPELAASTKQLAFNQGFYNLFLAVGAFAGVALWFWPVVSSTLIIVSPGSMLAAALVLVASDRSKARAALFQGLAPLLGLAFLGLSSLA